MRHMVQKQKGVKGVGRMKITMAHGGGGKDSADLMKNIDSMQYRQFCGASSGVSGRRYR